MMNLSDAPRARLFTAFGTVLYVDAVSGHLRHGPVESSPANAVFVAEPGWGASHRKGWLMQEKGDSLEPIACLPDHCQTVSSIVSVVPSAGGTLLELVPLERGLIAFTADGLFLMADPGGQLSLRASVCSTWECYLASENWCSNEDDDEQLPTIANPKFDKKKIRSYLVHPVIRKRANAKSTATKVLIYGYPQWSHGRVYYDLCKQLHRRGYIVDIINWQQNHSAYFAEMAPFYDLFMTALDGVRTLIDVYGVPWDRIIALSHHELDIRMLIEQKGAEIFDKFANYGVVSEFVYCASLMKGVRRVAKVVPLGVNFAEFHSKVSDRLATVGYAGSMSVQTYGIEWKRGELAEAAAREAGLEFRVAGSTAKQISFHDMPEFYRSVDAILISSVSEAAQLPVMEGAAAGRLVIGTPVGHFPRKAYEGGGILAPVEAGKFKDFTLQTLRYYKDNPAAYQDKCHAIQEAARRFDWKYTIDEWVELIESAMSHPHELARAHQLAGRFTEAAPLFARAAETNTGIEKRWHARWQEARCLRELGDEERFVRTALQAFHERPHRAEPLYDLAQHYIAKSHWDLAILYANAGMAIPMPPKEDFEVEEVVYRFGLREAFAIAALHSTVAEEKERGRRVCEWLTLSRDTPVSFRDAARCNSAADAVAAKVLLPSLVFHQLSIDAPEGLHPMNASICRSGERFILLASAINWILVDGPRDYNWSFLPGHSSGRSELLLLEIDRDFCVTSSTHVDQPDNMPPPQSKEEIGFNDPRSFIWRGALWSIATLRQLNAQARSEMALARIDRSQNDRCVLADWRVIASGMPVQWEKNWMPQVDGDDLRLIYSVDPTRVLADSGLELHNEPAPIFAHDFRGGSQAVSFDDGWLMLVHEHQHLNGKRHYFHRFIWMDANNGLRRLSRRFYFRKLGIEFAAGMAWHPDGERLVVSFSVQDKEQYLAAINANDVRAVLSDITQIERKSQEVMDRGKGLLKIIERLEGSIVEVKHENQNFLFVVTNPADAVMQHHHRGSFYEVEELQIIARHFTNGGIFVDIGANVGNHAIYVSRFMAASRIIVIEPNPEAIAILRPNLLLNNCDNVDINYLGLALAAQEGRVRGVTPYVNNLGHTTYFAEEGGEVRACTGDELLSDKPIEFIKVDVEGMEIEILSGLEKTIERWRPTIFVEVWDHAMGRFQDWCERAGYQIFERFQRYPGIQNYLIKPSSTMASKDDA